MIGFTNDRIGYTHDRTAYTHDRIRLTHERIGQTCKNNVAGTVVNPRGNILDMYVLITIFTLKIFPDDGFAMGQSKDFNPCCYYSVLVNRESEGPEYCIDYGSSITFTVFDL